MCSSATFAVEVLNTQRLRYTSEDQSLDYQCFIGEGGKRDVLLALRACGSRHPGRHRFNLSVRSYWRFQTASKLFCFRGDRRPPTGAASARTHKQHEQAATRHDAGNRKQRCIDPLRHGCLRYQNGSETSICTM